MALALPERIVGERVVVRRYCVDDADALVRAVTESIEHLRPWMPWIADEPQTVAQRRAFIERGDVEWASGEGYSYALVAPDDDALVIGGAGFHTRRGAGALEIGYWVHVDWIGHGIATEASAMLTAAALAARGIERVEIHHDKANEASAAIPRKLGYRFAGEQVDEPSAPGECGIDCSWVMTAADWSRLGVERRRLPAPTASATEATARTATEAPARKAAT